MPNATFYYVYRDTTEITSTAELTPVGTARGNYSEDTVPTNGTYYYVIVAGNLYGNSSISNCENITISLVVDGPDDRANLTWIWYLVIPLLIVIVTCFLLKNLTRMKGQK
ncbi:MAG: hypothetical protein ACFFD2_17360 [Promethearchaeota archaeon]